MGFCHWLGLCLPEGGPQLVMDSGHMFIHMGGGGTFYGVLCAPKGGEVKVDWEPEPLSKH